MYNNTNVVVMTPAQDALWLGEENGYTFRVTPQKGVISEPIKIMYLDNQNNFTLFGLSRQ